MENSHFDHVQVGDYVGFQDGPGSHYLDNVYMALRVEYGRFGTTLVVKNMAGHVEHVSRFTTVGIGCYYIGPQLPK